VGDPPFNCHINPVPIPSSPGALARALNPLGASGNTAQSKYDASAIAITLSRSGNPWIVSPLNVTGEISPDTTSINTGFRIPEFFNFKFTVIGANDPPGLLCAATQ
jgi:hypothetical protein